MTDAQTAEQVLEDEGTAKLQHEAGSVESSLIRAVERDARRRLTWERIMFTGLVLSIAYLAASILGAWLGVPGYEERGSIRDMLFLVLVPLVIPSAWRGLRCRLHLARLARADEATALESLLDSHVQFATESSSERLRLLGVLLSRVGPSDEERFTRPRISATAQIAAAQQYPHDLRMAALSALRFVADEQAAKQVASIANGPVWTQDDVVLRGIARLYLPEIEARVSKRRESDRLLRPADPPPETTLLRPAEGAPLGDEALLVRPVTDDPASDPTCARP